MCNASRLGALGLILLVGACSSSDSASQTGGGGASGGTSGGGGGAAGISGTGGNAAAAGFSVTGGGGGAAGISGAGGSAGATSAAGAGGGAGALGPCAVGTQGCACDSQQRCANSLTCSSDLCCSGSDCERPTSGAGGSGGVSTDAALACLPGMQGCACLGGKCAADLTCTKSMCCFKNDCQIPPPPDGGGTSGAGGSGDAGGQCVPGVIGPQLTDCGYPYSSSNPLTGVIFNESEVLAAIQPVGGSPLGAVRLFYNDEHALTLGVRHVDVIGEGGTSGKDFPVSPLAAIPSAVQYPETGTNELAGNFSGLDQWLRPMWPALFITDITNDPNDRSGDWQQGGRPWNPNAVYGTWKAAVRTVDTTVTPGVVDIAPDADPKTNTWNLGPGADPVPTAQITKKTEGYGAEVVWHLSLAPGHSYRVQVLVHDGDQNKVGGDVGEACLNFCAGDCLDEWCGNYKWDGGNPPDGGGGSGGSSPPGCPEGVIACGAGTGISCPDGTVCSLGCCLNIEMR